MALLDRVGTLLRANLNDLIDKAEDPEKTLKQLVLDMENQLLQIKTQVAIALADQHLLEKRRVEHEQSAAQWTRNAELAVAKGRDDLARAALERSLDCQQKAKAFSEQLADQTAQADLLRESLHKLQQKLANTRSQCELLILEHRRARTIQRAQKARQALEIKQATSGVDRMRLRVLETTAGNIAEAEIGHEPLESSFAALERHEQVEDLLRSLKERRPNPALSSGQD